MVHDLDGGGKGASSRVRNFAKGLSAVDPRNRPAGIEKNPISAAKAKFKGSGRVFNYRPRVAGGAPTGWRPGSA